MIPLRDDTPSSSRPIVPYLLILASVLAFLYTVSLGSEAAIERFVVAYGAIPGEITGRTGGSPISEYPTLLTSMFMHGGWMHLIGNMLFLWIFGNNIEDAMGHVRFVVFYLLCGIGAVFAQALPNIDSTIPMIGASGAISGVLGAYLLLFPHARVLVLIPLGFYSRTLYLPAMAVLGLWFILQLVNSLLADPRAGGVAFGAHIGGFIAGMVLLPLFKRKGVRLFAPSRH